MPRMNQLRIDLNPSRYRRMDPVLHGGPIAVHLPPESPIGITRSPLLLSSLPPIATDVDGVSRQFYGGPHVPTRRLSLP